MSVRLSAWNKSAPTGRFSIEFDIWFFPKNLSRKFKFHWNWTRKMGTLLGDQYIYIYIYFFLLYVARFLLEWEKFQANVWRKSKDTFMYNSFFFRKFWRLQNNVERIWYSRTGHRWPSGACALHAGYLRLQMPSKIFVNYGSSTLKIVLWMRVSTMLPYIVFFGWDAV